MRIGCGCLGATALLKYPIWKFESEASLPPLIFV